MKANVYQECLYYQNKIRRRLLFFNKASVCLRQKVFARFDVPYIEMFITTKCNLRCKHCSNMIPYLERGENIPFEEFKRDLDELLSKINRLYRLKIHGGEALLHPEICEIVKYADKLKKIRSIRIATNGTVLPSERVLKCLKESKAVMQISDYPAFADRADRTERILREHGVKYVRLIGQKWQDMGDIKNRGANRFSECSITRCTSFYKGKIYVCSRAAMMEEYGCNFFDGIDVYTEKKEFRRELTGLYNGKHCKACFFCDGDTAFAKEITAGEQLL